MSQITIWVDEVWRWPWLWPVVAVSFCFNLKNMPNKKLISKINDSKKLTIKKREEIFKELIELSTTGLNWEAPKVFFWLGVVDNFIIDDINIRQANKEAMRRSLVELLRKIDPKKIEVVIDWRDNYEFDELKEKPKYIIKWDSKVIEIWAASIIAKVFRDKLMQTYSMLYPTLWIENHKWYGTKKHIDYLSSKSKVTWIHRLTYKPVAKVLNIKK